MALEKTFVNKFKHFIWICFALSLNALALFGSYIPSLGMGNYEFLIIIALQFGFIVGLHILLKQSKFEVNHWVVATVLMSTATYPAIHFGGMGQSSNFIFVFLPVFYLTRYDLQVKSIFGLILIPVIDYFLNLQHLHHYIPDFSTQYDYMNFNESLFQQNSLILGLIYLVIFTFKQFKGTSSASPISELTAHNSAIHKSVSHHSTSNSSKKSTLAPKNLKASESPESVVETADGEVESLDNLEGVLESIVFFLSKNFKSLTATGFLSKDGGKTFTLNAFVSKKEKYINRGVVVDIGHGLIGSSALKENGFMSGDLRSYPEPIEYYDEKPDVNSLMAVRITNASGRIIGVLAVDSASARAFDDDDKDLMFRFSKVASMLISNVKMSSELQENSRVSELSYGLSKMMSEQLKPNDVLKVLMLNLGKLFDSKRQILCDVSSVSGQGRVLHVTGDAGRLVRGMTFGLSQAKSVYAKAFRMAKTELFTDFSEDLFRFNEYQEGDQVKSVLLAPILDERSKPIAVIGVEYDDDSEYKEADKNLLNTISLNASSSLTKARIFQKMEKQATIDGLTQIPNHRHFQDLMDMEMERAQREKSQVSLLLMDIDHFKKFNDTYGHPVGDLVLKMVSKALQSAVRKTDHIARYGGEEFVVILPQAEGDLGRQLAERVREAIENIQIPHESGTLTVTMSIGMCTYPSLVNTKAELIESADQALYYSKETGRNKVSLFQEIPKD